MIWRRRGHDRGRVLGSGDLTITGAGVATKLNADDLGVFGRSRQPFDELPAEIEERIKQEHPKPDEVALGSSRRLLAGTGGEGDVSLYAMPMSSGGVGYALSDASMQPQLVTRLRYGHYSVAQEYRVSAGERFDVYTYGLMLDNVEQMVISVEEQEYQAQLGENGYYLRHRAIGELTRVRAIRCVLADGNTTWQGFGPDKGERDEA
jgi:hypothetical protein